MFLFVFFVSISANLLYSNLCTLYCLAVKKKRLQNENRAQLWIIWALTHHLAQVKKRFRKKSHHQWSALIFRIRWYQIWSLSFWLAGFYSDFHLTFHLQIVYCMQGCLYLVWDKMLRLWVCDCVQWCDQLRIISSVVQSCAILSHMLTGSLCDTFRLIHTAAVYGAESLPQLLIFHII